MIKVNHLNKYFFKNKKNQIHVINDISLDFPDKGLVILLGASGSGKTTLLNVIGGLDKVQSGVIDFGNEVIAKYSAETWDKIRNESVGYIFQNYNLLPELSVFENVAFVLKMIGIKDSAIIENRVNYILKAVGMFPFRKKKSFQLSGGQMQRVAIARALVKNPKVIIADEPTGNLDSKNTIDVMNIIKSISKEKLVILVTHEKDMAKFYGDRIIEIKDGQVIDDYKNEIESEHSIDKDDTIYLKDLIQVAKLDNEQISSEFYSDHSEGEEPLAVKFIVKNKTLYLDIKTNYKKIKIIDENSGVIIKDEHYQKKTREEITQTTFELSMLDNKDVKREKASMVNIKQALGFALRKVLKTSAKGKLMLFTFILSGFVLAFAVATMAAVLVVKPEPLMRLPRGYVVVTQNTSNRLSYNQIMDLNIDNDENYYVNPFNETTIIFDKNNLNVQDTYFSANVENSDLVKDNQILYGRKPSNRYEIMISKMIADSLVNSSLGQEFGIWSYQDIFYESITYGIAKFKIVGIVDSEIRLNYMKEETALYIQAQQFGSQFATIPYTFIDQSFIINGQMPTNANEVVLSRPRYVQIFGAQPSGVFPKTSGTGLIVSGVYEMTEYPASILARPEDMVKQLIENSSTLYIYTKNSEAFAERVNEMTGITAADIYRTAYNQLTADQTTAIIASLSISGVLVILSLLGFYLVIRSSLFQRIYEVSVYRALGVRKEDIFRSFLVEIFVLTTITTLIGFIIASIGMARLQEGLLGQFNFFYVNTLSVIIGIILAYLINMIAGLLPVFNLLKKTPAQILAQYDI
jgi:putative ABC transport system permease protein